MTNLYEATLRCLRQHGKDAKDVLWVGDGNSYCSWEKFREDAYYFYFDSGYGAQEVEPKLIVCGDGWWLERREYDGSEWWQFCTAPKKPAHEEKLRLNAF